MHDPQPAAMLSFLRERLGGQMDDTKWIWRCHIDLTDANPEVWEFFRPFVEQYDASVWTMPSSSRVAEMDRVVHAPPCIDPLSVKNLDLAAVLPGALPPVRHRRAPADRVPGEPVRPVEGPGRRHRGVRIVREKVPDAQLVLAGSMATDDPEGFRVWEETDRARAGDRDIHLLSNLHQVGSVQINAFQRIADVVVQKSLREGFGLTVSEALWKGRPVVGGRAGASSSRSATASTATSSTSSRSAPSARSTCSPTRSAPTRWAPGPGARARELPLDTRARGLAAALRRADRRGDRRLAPGAVPVLGRRRRRAVGRPRRGRPRGHAAPAGHVVGPLATPWIAAALGDDRRAMASPGGRDRPTLGTEVRLDLDPRGTTCTTTSCRTRCCGSSSTACSTSCAPDVRRATSARRGTAYVVGQRGVRGRGRGRRRRGRRRAGAGLPARAGARHARDRRPDLRICYFTHTPFCGPTRSRCCPTTSPSDLLVDGRTSERASTRSRWARRTRAGWRCSATGCRRRPSSRRSARPRRRSRHRGSPTVREAAPSSTRWSATAAALPQRPHRPRRRTSCAASRPTTTSSSRIPNGERVVFVAMLTCSRGLAEYLAYRQEVEQAAERVNERWATPTWQPVVVDTRDDFERSVAGLAATTCCSSTR